MKNGKLCRILSYVLVALVSVAVTLAVVLGVVVSGRGQSKLDAVQQLIDRYFIGEVDQKAVEDAAAYAMVSALGDRWSYYIPAENYQSYLEQMRNAYVGVGITVTQKDEGILVEALVAGGPAEEAQVQVGDLIVRVGDADVVGMKIADAKKLIQGPANTAVSLTVLRDGQEKTLTVIRREIKSQVAKGQMLNDQIGLVTIENFNSNCASETIAAIEQLRSSGAQKLIFDVRNNPGGYASELVKVLDYLLPEGKLFTQVDYAGRESTDMSDANYLDMPMAVLINGESYSAAEFFAAALAEYEAAKVVGEKTVGKGYFQTVFELSDGSAVGLSIGKYFTPKGVSLAENGVTPHVTVTVDAETAALIYANLLDPLEDPQILAAMQLLQE